MFAMYPALPNDPCFCVYINQHRVVLMDVKVRKVLAKLVTLQSLSPTAFGFHAFRRSGATFAFQSKVLLQDIQTHGDWRSQAIWFYLINSPNAARKVATTFQTLLS